MYQKFPPIVQADELEYNSACKFWGVNRPYSQPVAELRRTQIKRVVKSKGILRRFRQPPYDN